MCGINEYAIINIRQSTPLRFSDTEYSGLPAFMQ